MPQRILTNPVRLTGSIHPDQLASLVAVDAYMRHRVLAGASKPVWDVITLAGDVAVQRAVQRAVVREGGDRAELGREGFAARAKQLELQAETDLQNLADVLHLQTDVRRWSGGTDIAARTARVAFVRLYDAGLLSRTDAVLNSCSSCETTVNNSDIDRVEVDVDVCRVALPLVGGSLEVDLVEPELLVGAVAVAVPASLQLTDRSVLLPIKDEEVPLISINDLEQPVLVVPGHDAWSYELARQLKLPVTEVLDSEGIVRAPGPLEALGRHAARAAAVEQLALEGHLSAHLAGRREVDRCHRCGTILVPLVGNHWVLSMADLVNPVLDAARTGELAMPSVDVLDAFLNGAERVGTWTVSQQLWSGLPIPVYSCLDCGQTQVSVEDESSCGACMGTLQAHTDVIDGRFVAAVVPLAMMGWPQQLEAQGEVPTTLLVGRLGLEAWALPMAALGLRLAGYLPYQSVALYEPPAASQDLGSRPTQDLVSLVHTHGAPAVRAALLAGALDLERGASDVDLFAHPPAGAGDPTAVAREFGILLDGMQAGNAFGMLRAFVGDGVGPEHTAAVHALAAPLLTDPTSVESAVSGFGQTEVL